MLFQVHRGPEAVLARYRARPCSRADRSFRSLSPSAPEAPPGISSSRGFDAREDSRHQEFRGPGLDARADGGNRPQGPDPQQGDK